ncbi:MAG: tRNA 2-thiouridine(34) synthase MnmA [Bacillota bacterium]
MLDKKRVVVGMSGGVDSSVAALLLKEQGYEVIGLFMRNWHEEDDSGACTAEADYTDVRRVANILDIPYYTIDLSREYQDRVFSLFLDEYKKGRTPNPDVLCNREIKFGPFKAFAEKLGADYIATGHYAGTEVIDGLTYLTRAEDDNKDQTYFLNQLKMEQIENVLFPLAGISKPEVRRIALENNLATATKKDSTGICFIGERDFRKFLSQYLPMKQGEIRTLDDKVVGTHDGVFYYTIGQRKGFGLGGGGNGQPYYIIKKDVARNILYVNQGECAELFAEKIIADDFNFITKTLIEPTAVQCRIRHRQPLVNATATPLANNSVEINFDTPVRGVASGQYAVLYSGNICIGGGVIR